MGGYTLEGGLLVGDYGTSVSVIHWIDYIVELKAENSTHICDHLRDNPAHPAKIDFLLEAIIVMKVTI